MPDEEDVKEAQETELDAKEDSERTQAEFHEEKADEAEEEKDNS